MGRDLKIQFIDSWGNTPKEYHPVPASKTIPEWYRKMPTYHGNKIVDKRDRADDNTNATAKKCIPFFDAMTAGYMLVLSTDLNVRLNEDGSHWFEWANGLDVVQFHPAIQLPDYPNQESREQSYPKFFHPWIIKTPRGYSSLFVSPIHQDLPFKTLEGVVDTDLYEQVILFPFVFIDDKFEGLIPAGTPIVQVIPFKREGWVSTIIPFSNDVVNMMAATTNKMRSLFNDGYKKLLWNRKQYK